MKATNQGKSVRGKRDRSRFQPRALDLFSGSGGLTLGLKKAGFTVVGGIEIDPLSVESYRENHPEVRLWQEDIRKIDVEALMTELSLKRGELELLAGCPPCQGFSTIRTRKRRVAVADPRNVLIDQFLRFVEALLPQAIMLENVPGVAAYGRFVEVKEQIRALGYRCEHQIFDAADFGVPQRRKRLVLIASRTAAISFAKPTATRKMVKAAIGKLPRAGESGDALHDFPEHRSEKIKALIELVPKNGGGRSDLPESYKLTCHKECPGFKDVYGRMHWNNVAPTITSGCTNPSKGRFLHPSENRAITLREAALLQGFPKRYFFSLKRGKDGAARLIGNAFPPEFARRFAAEIYSVLNENN